MSQTPKVWNLSRKRVPLVAAIVLLALCLPIRSDVLGAPDQQANVAAASTSSSQTAEPETSAELRGLDGRRWGWWRNHMRTSSPTSTAAATSTTSAPQGSTSASATLSSSSSSSTTSKTTTSASSSPTSPTGTVATLAGWPNASNTGVPAGITLATYSGPMRITVPNTVIDAKIINGTLTIATTGVQIKRSRSMEGSPTRTASRRTDQLRPLRLRSRARSRA